MESMPRALTFVVVVGLLFATAAARAEDRNAIAGFRFDVPSEELTPLERQRALIYRGELQDQLRVLDQQEQRGRLSPLDRRLLLDTRGEAERINNLLLPLPATGTGVSGSRALPSLSGGGLLPSH
jgi:hypothetical protein